MKITKPSFRKKAKSHQERIGKELKVMIDNFLEQLTPDELMTDSDTDATTFTEETWLRFPIHE